MGSVQVAVTFRELRLLLRRDDDVRRLCKFVFSNNDASIYVIPYGPSNRYAVGLGTIASGDDSVNYDAGGDELDRIPKLSIHETGRVHADAGSHRVGPVFIPPLSAWRGAHLATVLAETFDGLARHDKSVSRQGATRDWAIELAPEVQSAAVGVYVNGHEPKFDAQPVVTLGITRPTLAESVYIALQPRAQAALGGVDSTGGVIAMSGWTPGRPRNDPAHFLLIRGS